MRRLARTLVGLSAAAAFAALTAPDAGAQAEAKKQTPPAAEKKQPPPPPEKKQAAMPAHRMMNAADLKWGPAPAGLPEATQATVLDGDPGKAGLFTVRLKAPDGTQIMPHWHPSDEHVTVIAGTLLVGMGQKWDDAAMQTLNTGGHANLPRKQSHYVRMKGETIVQITAMGPFAITYANPEDDPRKKKTEK
jgi:quercetin dioxygenase-like cupin family protein